MTQKYLEKKLATILRYKDDELVRWGEAGKTAVLPRQSMTTRVSHLVELLQHSTPMPSATPKIGVFLQLYGRENFPALETCVQTVLTAAGNGVVDVIVAANQQHPEMIVALTSSPFATRRFSVAWNPEFKGADAGVFLQQLLLARELSLDHDIILKLHNKGKVVKQITDVCRGVESVQSIIRTFMRDRALGMLLPRQKQSDISYISLNESSVKEMTRIWELMSQEPLPSKVWRSAGSIFWVRAGLQAWQEYLLPSVPLILKTCSKGKTCSVDKGLESMMPTLVATTNKVLVAPLRSS